MNSDVAIEVCYVILFLPSLILLVVSLFLTKKAWQKAVSIFLLIHIIAGITNAYFYTTGSFDQINSLDKTPLVWQYSLFVLLGTNAFTFIVLCYLVFLGYKRLKPEGT